MTTLPYTVETDRPAQLGLIVLQADERIEADMRRLLPDHVETFVSRVPSGAHVTLASLAAMEAELARAASLFPGAARLRAVGYGCTSGSAQIGVGPVAQAVKAGIATAEVTEPVSAVIAACKELGVRRIGLLSPYIASVSARLAEVLNTAGIEITAFASFDESEEWRVARIAPASIAAAAVDLAGQAQMDALFMSCTNLQTLDIIADVEAKLGIPVLSSNQVLAWHLLRLAGVAVPDGFPGSLGKVSPKVTPQQALSRRS